MVNTRFRETGRLPMLALPLKWQWVGCGLLAAACVLVAIKLAGLLIADTVEPAIRFPRPVSSQSTPGVVLYPLAGSVAQTTDNLAESSVGAQLLGVIHLASGSIASIALKGQKEKVYRAGDSLSSGVTLEGIESNRVVIRERGVLKQITLKSLLDSSAPIQIQRAEPTRSEMFPLVATPVLSDEGVSGLRIDQLNADLDALNLVQQGDLVVAVDGVGLAALMADQVAVGRLSQREQLTLTIIRNGQETAVDIDGDLIRTLMSGN